MERPRVRVRVNTKATAEAGVAYDKVFLKVPPDSRVRVRFLPPMTDTGALVTRIVQHFNFKNEDGKATAIACLKAHGDGKNECPVCVAIEPLKDGTKAEQKLWSDLKAGAQFYAPVFLRGAEAKGIRLLKLSITPVNDLKEQLNEHENADEPSLPFTGDENGNGGYDVTIISTGSGMGTRYKVKFHEGERSDLSSIREDWETLWNRFDIDKELNLVVRTPDEIIEMLRSNYGEELDLTGLEDGVEA